MFWKSKESKFDVVIERLGPINIELLENGHIRLLNTWQVRVYIHKEKIFEVLTIPFGFQSDLSSFPTALSWIVDWRKVALAGLIHDYLYSEEYFESTDLPLSRGQKDIIWREVAKHGGHSANWLQAGVSWLGLVIGGASREFTGKAL